MASGHSSAASQVLQEHSHKLVTAISAGDPVKLAWELYSKKLIEWTTIEEINLPRTPTTNSSIIVTAVIRKVAADSSHFHKFIALLQEEEDLKSLGKKLQDTYDQFQSSSNQLPTGMQSPVLNSYAEYLRNRYTRSEFPVYSKWPPSPSKKFINLAIISKEKTTKEEADEFTKATLYGHIDQILKKKGPIHFNEILKAKHNEQLTCILIEGAPGIGKSTLAWQICTKWGKKELFQEFSIIILVRLRDDRVHKAKQMTDLFYHPDNDTQKEIIKEIIRFNGRGTLIILEGLDELPNHLLTEPTIFTDLLSGDILPKATILVTSRPSATDKLWENWNQQISRHIEIIGFTEENISMYAQSVLPEHELTNFNNYISVHPHIRSMLYVPLHCAIATTIYLQCHKSCSPPPRTLTELYTLLTQTILSRYLNDHPEYKGKNISLDALSNLPAPVYTDFLSLCKLAYEGVTKQQYIFHRQSKTLNHLGFMDAVPELYLQQQSASYSYNFLHLSIQEYLAAYHISLMTPSEQEKLLCSVTYHSFNMARFLAGITHFKGLNKAIVRKAIKISQPVYTMTLELLYECQDLTILDDILDDNVTYEVQIMWASVSELLSLGYCIVNSKSKWILEFINTDAESFYHELEVGCYHNYSIKSIVNCDLKFTHRLLKLQTEQVVLPHIETFHINCEVLPTYLLELIPRMERLHTLELENVLDTSVTELIRILSGASTLKNLALPELNSEGIDLLCKLLPTCQLENLRIGTSTSEAEMTVWLSREFIYIKGIYFFDCTTEFIDQVMLQLQSSLEHVESMTISTRYLQSMAVSTKYIDSRIMPTETSTEPLQPLPPCLPKLIPRMETLYSLTLVTVPTVDTSLTELIPILSKVPTLRKLALHELNSEGITLLCQWLPTSQLETLTISSIAIRLTSNRRIDDIEFSQSTTEFINQVTSKLSLEHNVKSLSVFTKSLQPLPPSLHKLIPRMETLQYLTLDNVLDTSLTKLIPGLSKLHTLRNLTLHELKSEGIAALCKWLPRCQLETHKVGRLTITLIPSREVSTIEFRQSSTKFINQVMSQLSSVHDVESLRISSDSLQLLPSCLPELIPRMTRLHELTLNNVLDSSLTELIPVLSKVHTLKKLELYELNSEGIVHLCWWLPKSRLETLTAGTGAGQSFFFEVRVTFIGINHIDTIEVTHSTMEFTGQVISPLQESLVHVKSMSIKQADLDRQPLPLCLLELIPRMEKLTTLKLDNVFDTSLIPKLSKVPTLRNLTLPELNSEGIALLCQCLPKFQLKELTIGSCNVTLKQSKYISTMTFNVCRIEFIDQIISQLQELLVHIKSMVIHTYNRHSLQPLPPSLLEVIPKMKRLNTLTLMSVHDASWTKLMPILSTEVPTLRNLTLHELNSDDIALFCQQLHLSHLEKLTVGRHCFIELKRIKDINCISTITFGENCRMEFIDQVIPQLQASLVHVESMTVSTDSKQPLPSCLLEFILKMKKLNTLTLENAHSTSLTKLIPALLRVPTLRNLTLPELNSEGISLLCQGLPKSQLEKLIMSFFYFNRMTITLKQSTETNCISTIVFFGCTSEFIDNILPQLETAHFESLEISSGLQLQPLPPCLLELIPRMERLHTLELMSVLGNSLTKIIPVLSKVPTLRNLTLPKLNSEGISLLCQWLSKLQLEEFNHFYSSATITLKQNEGTNHITIKLVNVTIEFIDQILSQLQTHCHTEI